jgi:hypothetical protein
MSKEAEKIVKLFVEAMDTKSPKQLADTYVKAQEYLRRNK